ncbi:TPA: hypothetical protein N6W35_004291 [Escherichia coli]|uniref:Uncharacterized protein n=3 Tax=Escherichia coli TaxID=562 RepID=A0A797M3T6_ECOLX|nr:hypothetical protein [Salmonella enterica subsp. enterica serovar Infantis]EFB6090455.1 hypothetical protein [Escherichia coli]EFN2003203.1 hypothetical protein [Escherichia coli]EGO5837130.1 hypothetical protein [Escherichia coli]EJE4976113.1 hypothetical protein [Escherichia coli]
MSAKMLSVPSDRGRQTYRSENVQTVMGILCPATVRPAPVFVFLHGGFAVKQAPFTREVAYV